MITSSAESAFVARIARYLPIAEKVSLALIVLGVGLWYLKVDDSLAMISFSLLAAVYFLNGYVRVGPAGTENERPGFLDRIAQTIVPKVMWIACAMSVVGILFYVLNMNGSKEMLMIAVPAMAMGLVLFAAMFAAGAKNINLLTPILYRAIPLFLIGIYLLML